MGPLQEEPYQTCNVVLVRTAETDVERGLRGDTMRDDGLPSYAELQVELRRGGSAS